MNHFKAMQHTKNHDLKAIMKSSVANCVSAEGLPCDSVG